MNSKSAPRLKERLVGTWTLQSYEERNTETGETNHPMGEHATGFIIYSDDGYMSAQISAAGRPVFADSDMFSGTTQEFAAAGQSYLAYSGPFDVDEAGGTVYHRVAVSLFPNWAGMRQVRAAALDGDTLRLAFERPQHTQGAARTVELVWRRAA